MEPPPNMPWMGSPKNWRDVVRIEQPISRAADNLIINNLNLKLNDKIISPVKFEYRIGDISSWLRLRELFQVAQHCDYGHLDGS